LTSIKHTPLLRHELPYCEDSVHLFARVQAQPWSVFLDSTSRGRYDILAALPYRTVVTEGDITRVSDANQQVLATSHQDPLHILQELLACDPDLPAYHGGAIGYCTYDLARRFMPLAEKAAHDRPMPEMAFGLYDAFIIVDHLEKTCFFQSLNRHPESQALLHRITQTTIAAPIKPFKLLTDWVADMDYPRYQHHFDSIKQHLQLGDCYQVNLAQRFHAPYQGDPWDAYLKLRACNPAPFSAYFQLPFAEILSLSPERFLKVSQNHVETKPIKGTRPRGSTPEADEALALELLQSAKDRAENVMIVDLLRNDLSRACLPGSVQVPALCALESFPAVHHLVSTVTGQLAPETSAIDLLRSCFPGGSITGAPKISAMNIIEHCEPSRRNLYCGSMVMLDANGDMDSNIAIRSLTCINNEVDCAAGGALVLDSDCESEYQECFTKVKLLLNCLQHTLTET